VPWAGSDWRASELCGNMLLYWTMLADSCNRGAGAFDFGRSTRDSGTHKFKLQWGAKEVPLTWQFLMNEGARPPVFGPDSPKYSWAVKVWRRLPLSVVRVLGPMIIRKLA